MTEPTTGLREELSQYDFVRFSFPDIHGIHRNALTAQRNVPSFLKDGFYIPNALDLLGPRSQIQLFGEKGKRGFPNGWCKPRVGTAHAVPWARGTNRVGEVLCDMNFLDGRPYDGCCVQAARRQVQRLKDKGYQLLSAFEIEFALLDKEDKPAFEGIDFFSTVVQSGIEDFLCTLDTQLAAAGVEIERMHCEYGPGQVEFSTTPEWGMKVADNYFVAKIASKEIAVSHGFNACYIPKPSDTMNTSGSHFTSSLWNNKGENVFSNPDEQNRLSEIAHHWIAGLCLHAPAISAFCAPTVNCYRRYYNAFTPSHASWSIGHRQSAFRAKTYGKLGASVENRLPSSAANPYFVLAANIAAGLDGIERKLACPPATTDGKAPVALPKTLQDALMALKEDEVMVSSIGPFIVNRFIENKEAEVKQFPKFEPKIFDPETLAKEVEEYKLI